MHKERSLAANVGLLGFFRTYYWQLGCLLIIGSYVAVVWYYATNVPFGDDFHLMMSVYKLLHLGDWRYKLFELANFHNEHRLVVPRLMALSLTVLNQGKFSIVHWLILGNLMLVGVAWALYRGSTQLQSTKWFLPVLLLLFQPMHYELMYWGMASLQNITVIALAFWALYWLTHKSSYGWAILIGTAAVFTSANGILVFVAGLPILLVKRRWRAAGWWIAALCLNAFAYWRGFAASSQRVPAPGIIVQMNRLRVELAQSFVDLALQPTSRLLLGFSLLAVVLLNGWLLYRRLWTRRLTDPATLFLTSTLVFVVLTGLLIFAGRPEGCVLCVSRYRLYIACLVAITYLLWADQLTRRQYAYSLALISTLLFAIRGYVAYCPELGRYKQLLTDQLITWQRYNRITTMPVAQAQQAAEFLTSLYRQGMYDPPFAEPNAMSTGSVRH